MLSRDFLEATESRLVFDKVRDRVLVTPATVVPH